MNLEYIPRKHVSWHLQQGWTIVDRKPHDYAVLMNAPLGWEQVRRTSDKGLSALYTDAAGKRFRLDGRDTRAKPRYKFVKPLQGKKCTVLGCEEKHKGRGLCTKHLSRLQRYGDVHVIGKRGRPTAPTCSECDRQSVAQGLCNKHYLRKRKAWTQKDHDFANRKLAEAACS
jgi:hypothetical protein